MTVAKGLELSEIENFQIEQHVASMTEAQACAAMEPAFRAALSGSATARDVRLSQVLVDRIARTP